MLKSTDSLKEAYIDQFPSVVFKWLGSQLLHGNDLKMRVYDKSSPNEASFFQFRRCVGKVK